MSTSRRLRRLGKDLIYGAGIRGLRRFALALTDEGAIAFGRRLGRVAYRVSDGEASKARAHLSIAFPEKPDEEIDALAQRCFENLGACVVEVLRMGRLGSANVRDYIEVVGWEHLEAARRSGNGVVALMAHFGNWELCGAALSWLGLPFSALVRDLRSRTLNRLLNAQRHAAGILTISRDRSLRGAVRTLKENGVLAILADIDTAVEGRFVEFFGRPAYTPVGPVVLSRRYGSPAVPIFLRRVDGPYHRLEIGPPIEWVVSNDAESALIENIARFTRIIEDRIRSAPEQWVWMHPRWRTQPG